MTNDSTEITPEIFISHRTRDRDLAITISNFISEATGDRVRVFCSSDDGREGLSIGNNLTEELARRLHQCSVVILLYTRKDDDWIYCMWECGVAYDPEHILNPEVRNSTKILVFQFSSDRPGPLHNNVCVDARSVNGIRQFVRQLLTDANFFPGYGEAVTNFDEQARSIDSLAERLYEALLVHWRLWHSENGSTFWPRMKLELDFQYEQEVSNSRANNNNARATVWTNVSVRECDAEASSIFNFTNADGRTLRNLFDEWRERNPDRDDRWRDFLITQIIDAINNRQIEPSWELLNTRTQTFVPIVLSCLRRPPVQNLVVEVCFLEIYSSLEVPDRNYPRNRRPSPVPSPINPILGQSFQEPSTGTNLLWIEGGRFSMGSDDIEPDAHASPCHTVQISGFWLAETPVTRQQYQMYLEEVPDVRQPYYWLDNRFSRPMQPVVGITWDNAMGFTSWLANKTGLDIRLPTEAQWEFAARGSQGNLYPWGDAPPDETRACFGQDEVQGQPCLVGSFEAGRGPFGTLDQSGNVWEWCLDEWNESAYRNRDENTLDPIVKDLNTNWRVVRGGGWDINNNDIRYLKSAYRMANLKRITHWAHGFRIALIPKNT